MPKAESSTFFYMGYRIFSSIWRFAPRWSVEMAFLIKICLAYSLFNSSINTLLY